MYGWTIDGTSKIMRCIELIEAKFHDVHDICHRAQVCDAV